jgi:sugar lactone lactonase YvrE
MKPYGLILLLLMPFLPSSAGPQAELPQTSSIETIAGGDASNVQGKDFSFGNVSGFAMDPAGNTFFTIQAMSRVYRLGVNGRVTVYAGNGVHAKNLNGVPAATSPLLGPSNLATDSAGNLYIVSTPNLLRVDARTHVLSTVLTMPYKQLGSAIGIKDIGGMAIGPDGALYFSDGGDWRIKRYSFRSGTVTVLAGNGVLGPTQPGVPAISSPLKYPQSVAVGWRGTVYFSTLEPSVYRIRRRDGQLEAVSIRLPNETGLLGENDIPRQITLDKRGHLFTAQINRSQVFRVVLKSGYVSVYAGTGSQKFNGDGFPAVHATSMPSHVVSDPAGNLTIAEYCRIVRIDHSTHRMRTIVGNGYPGLDDASTRALRARLWEPANVFPAEDGSFYITSSFNNRVLQLDQQGELKTIAGGADAVLGSKPGPALEVALYSPQGIWVDRNGIIYFSDYDNRIVRRIDVQSGLVTNFATTPKDFNGAGVFLYYTAALVADENYFYMSDPNGHRVWRISRQDGQVESYAGTEANIHNALSGDPSVRLVYPSGLALDSSGSLYIADGLKGRTDGRILRVDQTTGKFATILDNLKQPSGLAFRSSNVLCFSESEANQVKCLDLTDHTITVVAGTGEGGFSGDRGPAECAQLNRPSGINFDRAGNLYIADTGNQRIRRVHPGQNRAQCHAR